MRRFIAALFLLWSPPVFAQGVINIALAQQVNANGIPLAGALLYVYQVGTVATPQNTFQDFGLTLPNPWPLAADSTGRIPMFYLANGQVHVRLTDATGVVIFDYPTMQVVGPSGGGGGGGGSIDPTSIASTGDIKFRATGETITGWVKVNAQTIGSASSGASGRSNADTQNLFVYLWANCTNAHCPVIGGRGATALADFNANKQLTLPDFRGRAPAGLDDMGASAAGRIASSNVTSGGGDTQTTPLATGGEANHTMLLAEIAAHNHTITDPQHNHVMGTAAGVQSGPSFSALEVGVGGVFGSSPALTGITATNNNGSGTPFNNMSPFALGSFYIKL
jgi:microcystin-dependent protein